MPNLLACLLPDVTKCSPPPFLLALCWQGMFSNTKVECHVEATEDGRFVFAGLLRGSSEMLALDIADLPRWSTLPTPEVSICTSPI